MLFFLRGIPSTSSVFSAYASLSASVVLLRTIFHQFLPYKAQDLILQKVSLYLKPSSSSSIVTLLVEETSDMTRNVIYDAAEVYLLTKIRPNSNRLKVSRSPKEKNIATKFAQCEKIVDSFDGIEINWRFNSHESEEGLKISNSTGEELISKRQWFELFFEKEYKDKVLDSYLPFVLDRAEAIRNEKKSVKLHALAHCSSYGPTKWNSINFEHPSTFDTLAMDSGQKRAIVEDLDRFVRRKEYYQRVGKAWKRGYLLYGPPGTGKSSLISAIANYLGFDVYDLQLMDLKCDSDLRRVLLTTTYRSVIVAEDIDCSVDLSRKNFKPVHGGRGDVQLTLSGLLNFLDGLWSGCGDGRIIIFTTNHKDKLDPALLRPGRMDVHIHMSYCTVDGFKVLASNYLGISGRHLCNPVIQEIEDLIRNTKVTPAEVAEELMKSDNAHVSLGGLLNFLKRKKMESSSSSEILVEASKGMLEHEAKRQRIGC